MLVELDDKLDDETLVELVDIIIDELEGLDVRELDVE